MFNLPIQPLKLTAKHKKLLKTSLVDAEHPGTIVHDFEVMLDFFQGKGHLLTPAQQLPIALVEQLNARIKHPIIVNTNRAKQKAYPQIHGLYLLLRASKLTVVEGTPKKPRLVINPSAYQSWQSLNPTERYFTLLRIWLLEANLEILGERSSGFRSMLRLYQSTQWFFRDIPEGGMLIGGNQGLSERLNYTPGWHNLGLLDLFGIIRVQRAEPKVGQYWQIERIERTAFGEALLAAIEYGFKTMIETVLDAAPESESLEEGKLRLFEALLKAYFPLWKNNLSLVKLDFRSGTYTFKVVLGDVWRRIAIDASLSLDILAYAILNAFQFDDDHLYQFSYRTPYGYTERMERAMEMGDWITYDTEKSTDEVTIGELILPIGHQMTFLFDFGNNWEFDVLLEQLDPATTTPEPVMLEAHGEPPPQYRYMDNDDFDDDDFDDEEESENEASEDGDKHDEA
ncbi:MAG: plasmid pRiA4b ORF-3 family protein [Armatimonadetes bacterium]|nr:plasmid pRiA4b ORF-3 family protein [Anaerolineae bacterium]